MYTGPHILAFVKARRYDIETLKWCIGIAQTFSLFTPKPFLPFSPFPNHPPTVFCNPLEANDDSLLFQRISHSTYRKVCWRGARLSPTTFQLLPDAPCPVSFRAFKFRRVAAAPHGVRIKREFQVGKRV